MKTRHPYLLPILLGFFLSSCQDNKMTYDAGGTLEAVSMTLSAEGNGKILSLDIEEGDRIIEGQQLGQIDSTQLFLQKQMILAGKEAQQNQKPDARKQMATTQLALKQAESELQRISNLYQEGVATQQQFAQAQAGVEQLRAQMEAQQTIISGSIGSIDAQSKAQDIQIAQIDDMMGKCRIMSPMDGTVLEKYAQTGEQAYMGRPLLKIADLDQMILKAYINAQKLSTIQLGQKVQVFSQRGEETAVYEGVVSHISQQAEFTPKSLQTEEEKSNLVYAVKIRVKNDGYLKIGTYAYVKFL